MQHRDFTEKYKNGEIRVSISKYDVNKLALSGMLPPGYRAAAIFYSWIWVLSWIAALPIGYLYGWYWGVGLAVLGYLLPGALRDTNVDGIIQMALEDEEFYNFFKR